jgi:hypothetical protein
MREFEVGTKRKVVPHDPNYLYAMFGEFCATGRSPF